MNAERAREIFQKVIKEKEKMNVTSVTSTSVTSTEEYLHNGMSSHLSGYLKEYHDNKDAFVREIKNKSQEAEKLLEKIKNV